MSNRPTDPKEEKETAPMVAPVAVPTATPVTGSIADVPSQAMVTQPDQSSTRAVPLGATDNAFEVEKRGETGGQEKATDPSAAGERFTDWTSQLLEEADTKIAQEWEKTHPQQHPKQNLQGETT